MSEATCDSGENLRRWLSLSLCALGAAGLAGYVAIAACFGETPAGWGPVGAPTIVAIAALGFFGAFLVLAQALSRDWLSLESATGLAVALPVTLAGLIALDSVYAAYVERSAPPPPADDRQHDSHFAAGEFYPPLYYPTARNFRLHRPGISVTVDHYGDYYSAQMLQSQTLRDQVLSLKHVAIDIDKNGLREHQPLDGARIAALGDSFTFGWSMDDEHTWVRQLERRRGERVVNLGVHDGSPKQQLELLKHVLSEQGDRLPLKQVVWLLYEGNDLEDSYDDNAPAPEHKQWQRGMGPLLESLFGNIKDNMVIEQFRRNRVQLAGAAAQRANAHLNVDGVPLDVPLYRSAALGPALFLTSFIERAAQPRQYVLEHENRARLDRTFDEMAGLARARGFQVAVAMAPTAARLHGRYFDDFPELSESPHFIDYVGALAQRYGLVFIDLHQLFAAQAGREFLYFRDDDHWNEKGHALAAEMIARYAFDAPGAAAVELRTND